MWVIVEKNPDKEDRQVEIQHFRYPSIKMLKYIIKAKKDKKEVRFVQSEVFRIIYGLLYLLIIILIALFLYCCYGLYRVRECQRIDFNSSVCDKWRDF